jgi:hypothetical protein
LGSIGLALAVTLTLFAAQRRSPREPNYGGRQLHAWLEDIDKLDFRIIRGECMVLDTTNAAVCAIKSCGPAAVIWLRYELGRRESWLEVQLRQTAYKLPRVLQNPYLMRALLKSNKQTLFIRHQQAALGAVGLGDNAKPLAGELAGLLNSGEHCAFYSLALVRMDSIGIAPFTTAVTNQEHWRVVESALEALSNSKTLGGERRGVDLIRLYRFGNWITFSGTDTWPTRLELERHGLELPGRY